MTELSQKTCRPCKGGQDPLKPEQIDRLKSEAPDWEVVDNHRLRRQWDFPDFSTALEFVNEVGDLAEQQGHHPDIQLGYGKVVIEMHTHKIGGLSENDFIMAARIDRIPLPT